MTVVLKQKLTKKRSLIFSVSKAAYARVIQAMTYTLYIYTVKHSTEQMLLRVYMLNYEWRVHVSTLKLLINDLADQSFRDSNLQPVLITLSEL